MHLNFFLSDGSLIDGDIDRIKDSCPCPPDYSDLNDKYNISKEDILNLEIRTHPQNESEEWFQSRSGRLTASYFGKVLRRKKEFNEAFVNGAFNCKNKDLNVASINHGRKHESVKRVARGRKRKRTNEPTKKSQTTTLFKRGLNSKNKLQPW